MLIRSNALVAITNAIDLHRAHQGVSAMKGKIRFFNPIASAILTVWSLQPKRGNIKAPLLLEGCFLVALDCQ